MPAAKRRRGAAAKARDAPDEDTVATTEREEKAPAAKRGRPKASEKLSVAKMATTVTRQIIATPKAPAAIGPYSQAVRAGDTLYLSGSLGLVPETMELAQGIEGQTHQSLKNIGEVLKAAGVGYENVVKTTVLLANIDDFVTVNDIYKQYFKANFPARAAYQVAVLPKRALVEIEAVAIAAKIEDVPSPSL